MSAARKSRKGRPSVARGDRKSRKVEVSLPPEVHEALGLLTAERDGNRSAAVAKAILEAAARLKKSQK
jgi:hypothetical protein